MFNPAMLDPSVMSFFKQAGEAFQKTVKAEAEGRMDKLLTRHCGPERPMEPSHPRFEDRCRVYAAKAYAMAHIDSQITWGDIKEKLEESSAWPPSSELKAQGALFHSFMLGFLLGSDLPQQKQQAIQGVIPMAAQVASSPEQLAQQLGVSMEQLQQMAANPNLKDMMSNITGRDDND